MKESLFSANFSETTGEKKFLRSVHTATVTLTLTNHRKCYAEPNKLTTSKVLVLKISSMFKYTQQVEQEALHQKSTTILK